MNDETTDLNVALGIAIEQRNAAQNEIIRMAITIAQLTRKVAELEKAAKDAETDEQRDGQLTRKIETDEQRDARIAGESRKSNGKNKTA